MQRCALKPIGTKRLTRCTSKPQAAPTGVKSGSPKMACRSTSTSTLPFLGKQILPMGIGMAALGRPGYINLFHGSHLRNQQSVEEMQQQSWEVLDAAWALGIRYFDAARSYGKAEEFLSGWLSSRNVNPAEARVGSKWGYYYTADWRVDTGGQPHEIKDHTRPRLDEQSSLSGGLLGTHLNLYQVHSATLDSGAFSREVLDGLEQLVKQRGWRIGLSLSGPRQADTLRAALGTKMSDGQPLFSSVQATWNLLEQTAGPALQEAADAGYSIIIKEGVANGRLAGCNPDPSFAPKQALLHDFARQYGVGADAISLAAVIAQPWRPLVLSGACTVDQLRSNVQAIDLAPKLDQSALAGLQAALKMDAEDYWQERSKLAWN